MSVSPKVFKNNRTSNQKIDMENINLEPTKIKMYFNDFVKFYDQRVWLLEEIEDFFDQVFKFSWGGGKLKFCYEETKNVRFGKDLLTTPCFILTDKVPFNTNGTKIKILLKPSYEDLVEACNFAKMVPPQEEIDAAESHEEVYNITFKFLDKKGKLPEFSPTNLGTLFLDALHNGRITQRFHSFTIIPFLHVDPSTKDECNIFPGFRLRNRRTKVDVKETVIWKWLYEVLAVRDDYKMEYLLNVIARKLQFPAEKLQKYFILYGVKGSGKTSLYHFLTALLDRNKTVFADSIEQFMQPQNCRLLNKLVCFIDDIEKASKKHANALKATITSSVITVKKLFEDPIEMPIYLDLFCTSNSKEPAFVGEDDRRTELISVSPHLKGNKQFWDEFYKAIEDLEVMSAWFQYLSTMELTLDVHRETTRFDSTELEKQKINSMKTSHRFLVEFFQNEDCLETSCKHNEVRNWFDKINFENDKLYIQSKRLYRYFTNWLSSCKVRNVPKCSTFIKDLAELNLKVQRVRFVITNEFDNTKKESRPSCICIQESVVQAELKRFYKLQTFQLDWAEIPSDRQFHFHF